MTQFELAKLIEQEGFEYKMGTSKTKWYIKFSPECDREDDSNHYSQKMYYGLIAHSTYDNWIKISADFGCVGDDIDKYEVLFDGFIETKDEFNMVLKLIRFK